VIIVLQKQKKEPGSARRYVNKLNRYVTSTRSTRPSGARRRGERILTARSFGTKTIPTILYFPQQLSTSAVPPLL
jgi:hypothetical protein